MSIVWKMCGKIKKGVDAHAKSNLTHRSWTQDKSSNLLNSPGNSPGARWVADKGCKNLSPTLPCHGSATPTVSINHVSTNNRRHAHVSINVRCHAAGCNRCHAYSLHAALTKHCKFAKSLSLLCARTTLDVKLKQGWFDVPCLSSLVQRQPHESNQWSWT